MFVSQVIDVVKVVGKKKGTTILTLICRRDRATQEELEIERLSWDMIHSYLKREFKTAKNFLIELLELIPEDYNVNTMLKRVKGYIESGVPEDWNGAVQMDSK